MASSTCSFILMPLDTVLTCLLISRTMGSLQFKASGPLATDLSIDFRSPHLSKVEEGRSSADLEVSPRNPQMSRRYRHGPYMKPVPKHQDCKQLQVGSGTEVGLGCFFHGCAQVSSFTAALQHKQKHHVACGQSIARPYLIYLDPLCDAAQSR
jgi:hypothetical protein